MMTETPPHVAQRIAEHVTRVSREVVEATDVDAVLAGEATNLPGAIVDRILAEAREYGVGL